MIQKIIKNIVVIAFIFFIFATVSTQSVFAASAPAPAPAAAPAVNPANVTLVDPLNSVTLPQLAGRVIKAFIGIVGSLALLMFIWGGFLWLTAAGNTDRIKQGRDSMMWAVIGLVFIFSSYIIASFIIKALHG